MIATLFCRLVSKLQPEFSCRAPRERNSLISILSIMTFIMFFAYPLNSESATRNPIRTVIDLNIGDSQEVKLTNNESVEITLSDIEEICDELCGAVRSVRVKVIIEGKDFIIGSGNYNLPVTTGKVKIDCLITKGYYKNSGADRWGLVKDARIRLWPADSPYITPGTFVYPAEQMWFATMTQMSNEPTYVDGGEYPREKIYYHSGLDIGGADGMTGVLAATDGLVVSAGNTRLPGYEDTPVSPRYDVIYVLDDRGWYYRYSHLASFAPSIEAGRRVKMGEKIGVLGKEGGSGGWAHLHFEISSMQPSGKWGTEEGYAYLWESYVKQYNPKVIAVARPHHFVNVGQSLTLGGLKSRSLTAEIDRYEWTFSDGSRATGPVQRRSYDKPGEYSEILKVVDSEGNFDYDFAVVQVFSSYTPNRFPPSIHAAYYPTQNIKSGDPVTFRVRSFNAVSGHEVWDFGDGTPPVRTKSVEVYTSNYANEAKKLGFDLKPNHHNPAGYAATIHTFERPGHYLVRVERTGDFEYKAVTHLHVEVSDPSVKK